MKKCLFHTEKCLPYSQRMDSIRKGKASSKKRPVLLSLKPKAANDKPTGRKINAKRIDPEAIHMSRVVFNEQHFGCKKFYHENGKKTWIAPMPEKRTPVVAVKRIVQIIVPSNFFYVTDKTRKRIVCKRDVRHRVISSEEVEKNIVAHGENAVKEILIKEGIDRDSILTKKNVCYVTLHKQVNEEKIRELLPTLRINVFKIKK